MGVQKHVLEITSSVSAEKMFQGLVIDMYSILAKVAPGAYKHVETIGDGGAGTIKHITLPDGQFPLDFLITSFEFLVAACFS